ncbi:hypothetical protein HMPREF1624_00059 [Sporothrix schenckii ATCC 58251]|uniref:SAC domain-containing protein n=1 Tax=Sporothrix schenckii (strain ATCC 58251 / de Perez 2211183) TaxID=1391915 RepID=U7Q401_SPOS1|nr:hypothetical protein HMPREF1624_00059 [Sporothrix schenckii ATCC 58251]
MPGLARKVLICAAVDGLILHPLSSKKDQRMAPSVKIRYGDAALSTTSRNLAAEATEPTPSFEAFGIVGLILVSKFSYLVSITKRQQVATVRGSPIYVVTEVALTPCASYGEARRSIETTIEHLKERPPSYITDEEGSGNDSDDNSHHGDDEDIEGAVWVQEMNDSHRFEGEVGKANITTAPTLPVKGHKPNNSIAEDVISRRGSYGRFAQRWFSRSGWLQEQKRLMGLTASNKPVDEEAVAERTATTDTPGDKALDAATSSDSSPPGSAPAEPSDGDLASLSRTADETVTETASSTPPLQQGDHNNAEDGAVTSLLPKLLRTTQMLFGASRSFYFSYDYDITRSVAKQPKTRWNDLPLHKLVDTMYFWNRHAIQPFIDAGADALSLPLMQGFVGQRSFVVDSNPPQVDEAAKDSVELSNFAYRASTGPSSPLQATSPRSSAELEHRASEKEFDVTLISRRSVRRAGLRYLRRGVDEDGNVANAVETEQILSPSVVNQMVESQLLPAPPLSKTYSFVQVRGSIPLFWTQSPFSLKPVPVIQHSLELNYGALKNHFDGLRREYGSLQVVNLVEKHGVESALGTQFERSVQRYNDDTNSAPGESTLPFEWFDFHSACKGMKFENVSLLLGRLSNKIEQMGSTVEETGADNTEADGTSSPAGNMASSTGSYGPGNLVQRQKGVLRTNCMDCLDRTNVCQSSFAKFMLDAQLKEQGFDMAAQRDQENSWFNTLWADNGDAISKQYASTAAMKGDYTRTRKRDYRGALTDAGLSLTRFFNGIVNDFFLQTTIDFLLGNVTDKIFDEFEANMRTKDPAMSMQKMREQAVDLCQRRVVADESEEFIGGWTLIAPYDADISLTTPPFEEVVLLVTDAALYLCRFDWNLDKLSSFERVELSHIDKITIGTYIVSTVSPMQMDEERNVGFMVWYRPGRDDIRRINTRSLSSMHVGDGTAGNTAEQSTSAAEALSTSIAMLLNIRPSSPPVKRLAFKALYSESSLAPSATASAGETMVKRTEKDQIVSIATEIERLVQLSRPVPLGVERKSIIGKGDIVSVAEARKSTGLLGHLGHSLKKLVWA